MDRLPGDLAECWVRWMDERTQRLLKDLAGYGPRIIGHNTINLLPFGILLLLYAVLFMDWPAAIAAVAVYRMLFLLQLLKPAHVL